MVNIMAVGKILIFRLTANLKSVVLYKEINNSLLTIVSSDEELIFIRAYSPSFDLSMYTLDLETLTFNRVAIEQNIFFFNNKNSGVGIFCFPFVTLFEGDNSAQVQKDRYLARCVIGQRGINYIFDVLRS